MKIEISKLKPNPFKKNINNGRLDENTIKKIQSNMDELGLMGSLPVFKKGDIFHLIAGHHRLEALKREFGKDYQVEVTVHNYSEENVLRGMVVENLTQRNSEFLEEKENLVMIRNFLKKSNVHRMNETKLSSRGRANEGRPEETGSIRDIYSWLNKNGEVMALGKISQILSINDKLDKGLLKMVSKTHGASGKTREEKDELIPTRVASALAGLNSSREQVMVAEKLKETKYNAISQEALVTRYKNSPEEVKEKIRKGIIGLENIELAITQYNLNESKKKHIVVENTSKKIDNLLYSLNFSINDSEKNLKSVIKDLMILSKYYKNFEEKHKGRLDIQLERMSKVLEQAGLLIKDVRKSL